MICRAAATAATPPPASSAAAGGGPACDSQRWNELTSRWGSMLWRSGGWRAASRAYSSGKERPRAPG